jgi:sugar lactone lactonase YvrE
MQPCFSREHPPVFSSISYKPPKRITSILESTFNSTINHNTKWKQDGVTITNEYGRRTRAQLDCLYFPCGVYVDEDQIIYVADTFNHRIMAWKYGATTGQIVAGRNGCGNETHQLDRPINVVVDRKRNHVYISDLHNQRVVRWPCENGTSGEIIISKIDCRGLAIDNNGNLYVSDCYKNEVRRWKIGETSGVLVAGGNGQGNRLHQLYFPTDIVIDGDHSLYILDLGNRRVIKWMIGAKEGILVAGDMNGPIQLSEPNGLVVDHLGTVYVADWNAHRILRWCKGATQWDIIISGTEKQCWENRIDYPKDLSMDRQGNLYVIGYYNHRLQRFDVDRS